MEKESVVRLRITREEKVLLHKGRVFRRGCEKRIVPKKRKTKSL